MQTINSLQAKTILKMFLIVTFFMHCNGTAQTFTDSNLPIVIITTDSNQSIPDDPRILASMKIINRPDGTRNFLTDQNTTAFLNYNGRINIEIRGSSSQVLPKKPYGLTTLLADNSSSNNVSLLGMPKENDWILNALAFDPSLIRDYISYNLSQQMGNYAPRCVYCEVVINGEYQGLYLLQEKIKADMNRVNIEKIAAIDNIQPNLSGGYITKSDKTTGGDLVAWTMSSYAGQTEFIHDLPKPEDVTTQQDSYIHNQFTKLATTSHNNDTSLTLGYPSLIDVPSFIDFMISNELASNVDGYQLSTYFHKDRNGKLRAGPIWDFNLTYGNDLFMWGADRSKTDVWQFSNGDNEGAKFWTDLFNSPIFKCYLSRRWNALQQPGKPLAYNNLVDFINNTAALINEASIREQTKWGTIPDFLGAINTIKTFLSQRISWINDNVGSFSACNAVVVPALVIDKINYNPKVSTEFPESNDLEFIEITNNQPNGVNLTGIYFKELGITYRFPNNATIAGHQSVYLASNATQFQSKYGLTAFGEFTRNLSNKSQQLVLIDAFGNTIDEVTYLDGSPWPDADGNGDYLQLINPNLDNSLASSWTSGPIETLADATFATPKKGMFSPNPVSDILTVQDWRVMNGIAVFDILGNLIFRSDQKSNAYKIDCSNYPKGIYFLTVFEETGTTFKKIIKQ